MASTSLQEFLSQVRAVFDGGNPEKYVNEEPLRAELFSSEQLDNYAQALAKSHKLNLKRTPDRLLKRLADNEKILLEVRNLLTFSASEDYQITPAGEWLLDNFYLIEDHVRIAKNTSRRCIAKRCRNWPREALPVCRAYMALRSKSFRTATGTSMWIVSVILFTLTKR